MTDELRIELEQIWAAIRALSQNDNAHLANIKRMSMRLGLRELHTAAEEMREPGRVVH